MRPMSERVQTDGMIPEAGDRERLTAPLGRPWRAQADLRRQASASSAQVLVVSQIFVAKPAMIFVKSAWSIFRRSGNRFVAENAAKSMT